MTKLQGERIITIFILILCITTLNSAKKLKIESSQNAPTNIDTVGVTESDISSILLNHNRYRDLVARQATPEVGTRLPPALNMRQIYWSDEIARKAQEWANQCTFAHSSREFRTLPNGMSLGENLAIEWSPRGLPKNFGKQIGAWYLEISDYANQSPNVERFAPSTTSAQIGHFTQVVWAETYLVGCGFAVCPEDGLRKNLYVCQYGPAGNFIGRPVYLIAEEATDRECPAGTVASSEFTGLCCIPGKCTSNDLRLS
jgi:hypothetical protein